MRKSEYLAELRTRLAHQPAEEVERAVAFYEEAIDDRVEAGEDEAGAVGSLEPPERAAERILAEEPPVQRVVASMRGRDIPRAWVVTLVLVVILGSPLWLSLLAAALAVVFAAFAVLGAALLVVWVFVGVMLLACPCGLWVALNGIIAGEAAAALMGLGAGVALSGAGLLSLVVAVWATGGICRAIAWLARKLASLFVRQGPLAQPPAWEVRPLRPAWGMVRTVGLSMLACGLVALGVGWLACGMRVDELARQWMAVSEVAQRLW